MRDSDHNQASRDREEASGAKVGNEGHIQEDTNALDVNIVFVISVEFRAPESPEVAELAARAEWAMFERSVKPGEHMKPLYIRGHIDGTPVRRMMVDGSASINIIPLTLFEKLGWREDELNRLTWAWAVFQGSQ
jgi:hypothetical protein